MPGASEVASGAMAGAALGGSIGSVVPGAGTAIGAGIGGIAGGIAGWLKKDEEDALRRAQEASQLGIDPLFSGEMAKQYGAESMAGQRAILEQLMAKGRGEGEFAADIGAKLAAERGAAHQAALAASAGPANAALAQRQAASGIGRITGSVAANAAMARAQEQQAAQSAAMLGQQSIMQQMMQNQGFGLQSGQAEMQLRNQLYGQMMQGQGPDWTTQALGAASSLGPMFAGFGRQGAAGGGAKPETPQQYQERTGGNF